VSDIHPHAAVGFGRAAGAYERGRPGYPSDALAWLAERLELGPGRTVLDLAAGTGALTRALLTTGAEVVAVEPVAEMRSALPAETRVLDGTAEAIPLGDATADAVTVAQAFHWFDGPVALAEIHRVLRPGGVLALVWNRRDQASPVNRAIDTLLAPYRHDTPSHATDAWRAAFAAASCSGRSRKSALPTTRPSTPAEWRTGSDRSASWHRYRPVSAPRCWPPPVRWPLPVRSRSRTGPRSGSACAADDLRQAGRSSITGISRCAALRR
jgi:SAM-dependent methyltransferase